MVSLRKLISYRWCIEQLLLLLYCCCCCFCCRRLLMIDVVVNYTLRLLYLKQAQISIALLQMHENVLRLSALPQCDTVTQMLPELGLPSFNTLLLNSQTNFARMWCNCPNKGIQYLCALGIWCCVACCLNTFNVSVRSVLSVCSFCSYYSLFLSFLILWLCFMDHAVWNKTYVVMLCCYVHRLLYYIQAVRQPVRRRAEPNTNMTRR